MYLLYKQLWVDQLPNVIQPKRLFQTRVCVCVGDNWNISEHYFSDSLIHRLIWHKQVQLFKTTSAQDWLTDWQQTANWTFIANIYNNEYQWKCNVYSTVH